MGWILLYFVVWALAIVWVLIFSGDSKRAESIRDGGVATLSFGAGMAAVGFVAVGLAADIGVAILLVLAGGVAAVIFPTLAIGKAWRNRPRCKNAKHKWEGCKCKRCGATRNEGHKWQRQNGKCNEKCAVCGREGGRIEHQGNGCKCLRCGAALEPARHDFRLVDDHLERCLECGAERYRVVPCAWEKSYLKQILEWSGNFSYAAPDKKYIALTFPFASNASACFEAMNQESCEPKLSLSDFEQFVRAGNGPDELAQQMDTLFRYFAHTHNPKLDARYANACARVHGLDGQLLVDCYKFLTHHIKRKPNNNTAAEMREGREAQKEFEEWQRSLGAFSTRLPAGIYFNLLHLLAVKRDVAYQMNWQNDDYSTVTGEYCSVKFGPIPAYAAEKLAEHSSPPYSVEAYEQFPRQSH